jgi:hypothetical protein
MLLFGVGTDSDATVSESVLAIQHSTNEFSRQKHEKVRVSVEEIREFIADGGERRVVFVSHGSRDALLDASARRIPYITAADAKEFDNLYLLAYACSSGAYPGGRITRFALLYIGFDSVISAPPSAPSVCYADLLGLYRMMLSYLFNVLIVSPQDGESGATDFLRSLREQSIYIEMKFDTSGGSTLDAEELICIRQFREDISVWVRGVDHPIKCEGERPRALLW